MTSIQAPLRVLSRPLVGVSLAYFMVLFDITVLAVAEPDLIHSLHTGVVGVGWATTSYTIVLAASLVLAGALADRVGPAQLFRFGTVAFGAISLACAASQQIGFLVGARAFLGLAAAAVIPASLSLIARLHPDPRERGRAIGVWATISGVALAAGPVIGGVLVESLGWRAVFAVNVPVALLVVLVTADCLPDVPGSARAVDPVPHALLAATLATGTFAITEAGQLHWRPAAAAVLGSALLLCGTVGRDSRSRSPIVPVQIRRNVAAWATFAWGAAANYALTTILFTLPLSLRLPPAEAGLMLLPMTAVMAVNPLFTGRIVATRGALLPIRLGLAGIAVGTATLVSGFANGHPPVTTVLGLLVCGLGMSWTLPSLVAYAVDRVPSAAVGSLGGILNAARQIGASLGAAVASALITFRPDGGGTVLSLGVAAALGGASAVSALVNRE